MQPVITGLRAYFRLSRLPNAILPALAIVAGAVATGKIVSPSVVYALVSFVLLHSFVTVWNDIRDEATDKLNGISRVGDVRRHGGMPVLCTCLGLSLAVVVFLMLRLPVATNGLLIGFVLLGWLYNNRPLQASRRPILSIIIMGLSYGLVPFLIGTNLTGFGWAAIVLAAGWTCIRTSLSLLKDYKDAPGDAEAGKKTFLLVYGHSRVARFSFGLAVTGYAACVVTCSFSTDHSIWAAISLGGVAFWLISEHSRLFRLSDYGPLNKLFHDLITYEIIFMGLLIAWLSSS